VVKFLQLFIPESLALVIKFFQLFILKSLA